MIYIIKTMIEKITNKIIFFQNFFNHIFNRIVYSDTIYNASFVDILNIKILGDAGVGKSCIL